MAAGLAATLFGGIALGALVGSRLPGGVPAEPGRPPLLSTPTQVVFDPMRGMLDQPIVLRGLSDDLVLVRVGMPYDATNVILVHGKNSLPLLVQNQFALFLWNPHSSDAATSLRLMFDTEAGPHSIDLPPLHPHVEEP